MIELAHKDVKTSTINILFVFKKIKENRTNKFKTGINCLVLDVCVSVKKSILIFNG